MPREMQNESSDHDTRPGLNEKRPGGREGVYGESWQPCDHSSTDTIFKVIKPQMCSGDLSPLY